VLVVDDDPLEVVVVTVGVVGCGLSLPQDKTVINNPITK
jgi:hypothetical protein